MRIISGDARGKIIEAPQGLDTRPVTDKIRQALFNIWQFDIPNCDFLDLFSGSGSMGLEAMSRHAHCVIMVEKEKKPPMSFVVTSKHAILKIAIFAYWNKMSSLRLKI